MTKPKPPTYDELTAEVAELRSSCENYQTRVGDLTADRDAWRAEHRKDDEAEAIESCIRAITAMLAGGSRPDRMSGVQMYFEGTPAPAERVLRYLALRFGVAWPKGPTMAEQAAAVEVQAVEDVRAGDRCEVRDGVVRRMPDPYR